MSDTKHVMPTNAPPHAQSDADELTGTETVADSVVETVAEPTSAAAAMAEPDRAPVDDIAAAAVDEARAAAEADVPGWRWAVTVARASRSKSVTVDDIVLLPGDEALLAPEWLPWSERLRPGDLGVGDLLPTAADDPRLAPAFLMTDDEDEREVSFEFGLGRERVLSYEGMVEAVDRWYSGEPGPEAAMARAAPAACASCGFYVPLSGALRQAFGACANEYAPDDGRVVAVDHGCGAHSQAVVIPVSPQPVPDSEETFGYDVVGGPLGHEPGSVSDTEPAEALGHS
jgi:hypothetical protein